jgi:hypothetical protein
MTEAEWLACNDRQPMLAFLMASTGDRKLRLFACACCRRVWHLLRHQESQQAVEIAERFADGSAEDEERHRARKAASQATQARGTVPVPTDPRPERRAASSAYYVLAGDAAKAANGASELAIEALIWQQGGHANCLASATISSERNSQACLLRDIFGNPFRPVPFLPEWRTDTAVALARRMYESRDFGAMPILADALQDVGCDNEEILNHCRDANQPHVRGCWVVDLVLGKEQPVYRQLCYDTCALQVMGEDYES